MTKHYIIYIPGLGDHWDRPRQSALALWRIFGVQTQLVSMQWYDGQPYRQKFDRINAAIDHALDWGYSVSLIGESAGASIALNVFATRQDDIHRIVTLCGVVNPDVPVSPVIYGRSPGFKTSMSNLMHSTGSLTSVDKIRVITALYDTVVSHRYNILDQQNPIRVWSIGHLTTVAACLTLYSWLVVRQIKK